jgi:hypothetical protein
VGREHRTVLGKHSGSRAVRQAYAKLGIALTDRRPTICWRASETMRLPPSARPDGEDLRRFYRSFATCGAAQLPISSMQRERQVVSNILADMRSLSAAEDFFEYLALPFDPAVLQVTRLHVLKRFNQYLEAAKPEFKVSTRRPSSRPAGRCCCALTRISSARRRRAKRCSRFFRMPKALRSASTACAAPAVAQRVLNPEGPRMHIVVCIKQVPDSAQIRVHPVSNTIMRQGVPAIVNPYDLFALEEALRLKDRYGGRVTVLCMGPSQADAALRKALSFGADEAILLSDRAFAGSDTLATSYALAAAIQRIRADMPVDLVFAGKADDRRRHRAGRPRHREAPQSAAAHLRGEDRCARPGAQGSS